MANLILQNFNYSHSGGWEMAFLWFKFEFSELIMWLSIFSYVCVHSYFLPYENLVHAFCPVFHWIIFFLWICWRSSCILQYINPYVCYRLWFIFSLSPDKQKFLNMSLYMSLYYVMIFVSYLMNSFPTPRTWRYSSTFVLKAL